MAQGPQGPQRCFLVPPDGGSHPHDLVARRQVSAVPANTRLQLARGQAASALPKPIPVRVAIIKPTTAEQPRLKHTAVAPVPVADVHRRKAVKAFDEIWPNWRVPAGIRTPYSPTLTKMLGAMAMGDVVGSDAEISGLALSTNAWRTQMPNKLACFKTCQRMIGTTAPLMGIYMVTEKDGKLTVLPTMQRGMDIINDYMKNKTPIIVGVNHIIKIGNPNHDKTTDHFIVLVEKGSDSKGIYYRFFDPGTKHREFGTHPMNRLYLNKSSGFFEGYRINNRKQTYTLCWVRPSKN